MNSFRYISVWQAWFPVGTEFEKRQTIGFYTDQDQALLAGQQAAGSVAHLVTYTSLISHTAIDLGAGRIVLLHPNYPHAVAVNRPLDADQETLRASARSKLTDDEWDAITRKERRGP